MLNLDPMTLLDVEIRNAELTYLRQLGYLFETRSFPSLPYGKFGFILYQIN